MRKVRQESTVNGKQVATGSKLVKSPSQKKGGLENVQQIRKEISSKLHKPACCKAYLEKKKKDPKVSRERQQQTQKQN